MGMEEQANELRAMMGNGDPHKTRIIAITSGKGGVGKTNVAVNMAIAYAEIGKRVILIDGDMGMANVNVLLNIVPRYNLLQVINRQKKMSEIILDTEFGIKFIAGANGFSKIANLSKEELCCYNSGANCHNGCLWYHKDNFHGACGQGEQHKAACKPRPFCR